MLSYEDSLRLKKLGYDQQCREGDWYWWTKPGDYPKWDTPRRILADMETEVVKMAEEESEYYVKVPTIEGMIKGLGESLLSIKILPDGYSLLGIRSGHIQGIIAGRLEEALCKLWESVTSSLVTTLREGKGEGRIFSENVRKKIEGVIEELVKGQTQESGSLLLPRKTLISMTVDQIEEILEEKPLLSE